jgi:peptidoglycan/LPS O-acetylase OafA/YrhL
VRSHRFDPVSAALGLVALVAAILVIAGSTVPFDAEVGPWLAAIGLLFGILVLPRSLRRTSRAVAESERPAEDG